MLVTRPFTNEEVAARLELGCLEPGMIAEACRRLRGLPGSGERERPEVEPQFLKDYAAWASKYVAIYGWLPTSFDTWCMATNRSRMSEMPPLPTIEPHLLEVGK